MILDYYQDIIKSTIKSYSTNQSVLLEIGGRLYKIIYNSKNHYQIKFMMYDTITTNTKCSITLSKDIFPTSKHSISINNLFVSCIDILYNSNKNNILKVNDLESINTEEELFQLQCVHNHILLNSISFSKVLELIELSSVLIKETNEYTSWFIRSNEF